MCKACPWSAGWSRSGWTLLMSPTADGKRFVGPEVLVLMDCSLLPEGRCSNTFNRSLQTAEHNTFK